jgi:hypothetical protein
MGRSVSPGLAGSRLQAAGYRAAAHRPRPGRLAWPEQREFAEPPQQPPRLDQFQQFPQPALGAAALRRGDDTAAEHFPELVLVDDNVNLRSPSPDSITRPPRPVVTLTLYQ